MDDCTNCDFSLQPEIFGSGFLTLKSFEYPLSRTAGAKNFKYYLKFTSSIVISFSRLFLIVQ